MAIPNVGHKNLAENYVIKREMLDLILEVSKNLRFPPP